MMWESLGRTVAELPHLAELMTSTSGPGWEVAGVEILREQAARGGPAIFFSGHIGNWEMLPPILARLGVHMWQLGCIVAGLRRKPSRRRLSLWLPE